LVEFVFESFEKFDDSKNGPCLYSFLAFELVNCLKVIDLVKLILLVFDEVVDFSKLP